MMMNADGVKDRTMEEEATIRFGRICGHTHLRRKKKPKPRPSLCHGWGEIEGKVGQSLILWSTCSLVNLLQYILSLSSGGCSTLCGPVSVGWWRWFLWISATSTRGWCWLALLMMLMACWLVGEWSCYAVSKFPGARSSLLHWTTTPATLSPPTTLMFG